MTTNKSVEEIVEDNLYRVYGNLNSDSVKEILTEILQEALTSHTNTVLQGVVEKVEEQQKEVASELQDDGNVLIKKLYTEEEKRAYSQGSYLSLETVLSLLNDQIISNEK